MSSESEKESPFLYTSELQYPSCFSKVSAFETNEESGNDQRRSSERRRFLETDGEDETVKLKFK